MAGWQTLVEGAGTRDIRSVNVLDTIAGAKKCEIVLRDVKNMNTYTHFDDLEVWAPVTNPSGGLIFDGTDDYIELATTLEMDSDDWSISWWMKRSAHDYETIFCETKTGASGVIEVDSTNNYIRVESSTNATWSDELGTGIDTSDGAWHHYVLVFAAASTKLYVDNTLADTGTANSDSAAFDINFIGHAQEQTTPYGDFLAGSLYNIRVFDSAIDTDEISRLYIGKYSTACYAFLTMTQSTAVDDGIFDRFDAAHGTSYTGASTKGALTLDTAPLDQFIAFKGSIESMLPDYDTDTITIIGRDYIGGLLTKACVEAYTTQLRSYIVNDIILKYGTAMTRRSITNSPAGDTLSYLFKTSAWDAIIKCAKEDGYRFWVDCDKDFHYHTKGYQSSGVTLEVGVDNILGFTINEMGSEMVNRVTIYGEETAGTQVIAMVEDLDSQAHYGVTSEKRIVDLSIETEADAIVIGEKYLDEHSYVLDIIEMKLIGNQDLTAGDLITLKIPDLNIDGSYLIINKQLQYPKGYTSIKVAKYAKNLEGLISDMVDKILMLERFFMEESSAVTKIHRVHEQIKYTDQIIIDKRATADSFKIGVDGWCKIGVTKIGGRGSAWTNVYNSG